MGSPLAPECWDLTVVSLHSGSKAELSHSRHVAQVGQRAVTNQLLCSAGRLLITEMPPPPCRLLLAAARIPSHMAEETQA